MFRTLAIVVTCLLCVALPRSAPALEFTGITGGSQPHENMQPSLGMNYIIHLQGDPSELGEVSLFGGSFAPGGWAQAAGQLMPIAQNKALFDKIGTTYGGDGVSTFGLPDLRGRAAIGDGQGTGLSNRTIGEQGGVETVTLTQSQIPVHNHPLPLGGDTTDAGGSQPHENMQPFLALNYTLPLQAIFPSPIASLQETPFLGQVRIFAGASAPAGYASADGQLLPINQNTALFSLLGTSYGGDGKVTFALPDLRGTAAMGAGQGFGLTDRPLGAEVGVESATLTLNEMAAHDHTLPPSADTTFFTGGGSPHENMQPSLALNYLINTSGNFPSREDDNGEPFMGQMALFGGNFAPLGWQFCDGQFLPIAQNTALFALLGTTYGGNGQTTFALPDLRGRIPLGFGQGPGLDDRSLGEQPGSESVTLTVAEMPAHNHAYVPEPATWVLAALGLIPFAWQGWRRTPTCGRRS